MKRMFSKFKSKKQTNQPMEIMSPVSGKSVPLTEVPDEAFAGGHMGKGIAIEPADGRLIAPFDGKVAHVVKSKHAVMLEHASGLQMLFHIGVNTVKLKGEGFTSHIAIGDDVKAGQTMIEFDLDIIRAAGYSTIIPVIVTTGEEEITWNVDCHYGQVTAGKDSVLTVTLEK